ncbi:hypothetical protein ATOBIA_N15710 [Atopobiaceae bacterium P1]|uniref:Uncharacterized protein n=1 Tax=Leptogranulimonas caecicola TaxID=2894156 RepID=A0AAU9CPU1_9ACTN|nr:hypothetical protein ATOBIA_N15710 [Atopobiaceae bacterium P1]BDC91666.1 hypothetical protein ATTO_15380 [Leptogranulimonas caecicola]
MSVHRHSYPTTIRATLRHGAAAKIFTVEQGCCAHGGHLSAIRRQLRGSGQLEPQGKKPPEVGKGFSARENK